MQNITILALTLNEIDGVKIILPEIKLNSGDQLIVVDGGSKDGTIEWCKNNGYEVYIQKRKGIRYAYLEVLPLVKNDIIVTLSPDGNCPPNAIPEMVAEIEKGADLVIASRYLNGATSEDDDLITGFGNWLFTKTVNFLYGAHYTDAMVIYRAFRKHLIYDLDLDKEESYILAERLFFTKISWEPLMSVRAAKFNAIVAETSVGEPPRIGGVRKLQIIRWGAAFYFQFIYELFLWKNKKKGKVI